MNTRCSTEMFLDKLLKRTVCSVKVVAVIIDSGNRKIEWGWNNSGSDGNGEHAEACAIKRANRKRLLDSTIYVKGIRARNNKPVLSKPCINCQKIIKSLGIKRAVYITSSGDWESMDL